MPRRALPTATNTAWVPRSASRPTSCTRAGRWVWKASPPRNSSCWATAKCEADPSAAHPAGDHRVTVRRHLALVRRQRGARRPAAAVGTARRGARPRHLGGPARLHRGYAGFCFFRVGRSLLASPAVLTLLGGRCGGECRAASCRRDLRGTDRLALPHRVLSRGDL